MSMSQYLCAIFAILALGSFIAVDSVDSKSSEVSPSLLQMSKPADLPGNGPWVLRVEFSDPALLEDPLIQGMDIFLMRPNKGFFDVQVFNLEQMGYLFSKDFNIFLNKVETSKATGKTTIKRKLNRDLQGSFESMPEPYDCFRTVEGTYATAESIQAAHPDLATWIDVGDSWEKKNNLGGYDIMVLKLTNSQITGEKPVLFANCAIHAREYATAELCTRFAEHLVDGYGTNADLTWILDYNEVHLMLQTNPDGRKKAEAGDLWRKNTNTDADACNSFFDVLLGNFPGVDLNRNFDFYWNGCAGDNVNDCSSSDPCTQTYRGTGPASEPEMEALTEYVKSIFPDQRAETSANDANTPVPSDASGIALDIHAYGRLVLYPWGFTETPSPNADALFSLARKLAYYNDYEPDKGIGLYATDGTSKDFYYGRLGVASFVFELGDSFFEDCSLFEDEILPDNLNSLIYAAKAARTPYLTPVGPETFDVSASPASVTRGSISKIRATVDDTRFGTGNGIEPSQDILRAEAFVDIAPWEAGATRIVGTPVDGSLDSDSEVMEFEIDTTGLGSGRHTIYVHGVDTDDNIGAVSAVFLNVEVSDPTMSPSKSPSVEPTTSSRPSEIPSRSPSDQPSKIPSSRPSEIPSRSPSDQPSESFSPSDTSTSTHPSRNPSRYPSVFPTSAPSFVPSGTCKATKASCLADGDCCSRRCKKNKCGKGDRR